MFSYLFRHKPFRTKHNIRKVSNVRRRTNMKKTYEFQDGTKLTQNEIDTIFEGQYEDKQKAESLQLPFVNCPYCNKKVLRLPHPKLTCKHCKKTFPNYKTKCENCSATFIPMFNRQIYCASCAKF